MKTRQTTSFRIPSSSGRRSGLVRGQKGQRKSETTVPGWFFCVSITLAARAINHRCLQLSLTSVHPIRNESWIFISRGETNHQAAKDISGGNGGTAPHALHLGGCWRRMVEFMPQQKNPRPQQIGGWRERSGLLQRVASW